MISTLYNIGKAIQNDSDYADYFQAWGNPFPGRENEAKVIKEPYTLNLKFDDGTEMKINLEPVLIGNLLGLLKDKELFKQVRVNPEVHTVEWPNGADFDPSILYQWEDVKDEFIEMTRQWEIA